MEHYHSSIRKDIAPLVPQAHSLLDIGGGTGATARYFRDIGRVNAISVMDAVIEQNGADLDSFSAADLNDHAAVADYLEKAGPFDVVTMLDVLEHLIDPWSFVDVVARAVKPGGVLIASIPNIQHISVSSNLLLGGKWDYADAGLLDRTHLRFFVKDSAIAMMSRPGLSVQSCQPSPIGRTRDRLINHVTFGIIRPLFTLQWFVVSRKIS